MESHNLHLPIHFFHSIKSTLCYEEERPFSMNEMDLKVNKIVNIFLSMEKLRIMEALTFTFNIP